VELFSAGQVMTPAERGPLKNYIGQVFSTKTCSLVPFIQPEALALLSLLMAFRVVCLASLSVDK
jgi:hypothetical protein